jgi:hypothetical protein
MMDQSVYLKRRISAMPTSPMAAYDEIDNLNTAELRFRQACQFYALFKGHHGPSVDPQSGRFLWMCYADAFLMSIISLKDFVPEVQETALKASDLFRMMTVLRNVTTHRAVVSMGSPMLMINRDISIGNQFGHYEDPVLNAVRITGALDHYEQELRRECMWRQERRNIEGARRWNASLAANDPPRVPLYKVVLDAMTFVANICGLMLPAGL